MITWAIFCKEFHDHYFPFMYQDIKQSELFWQVQESMIVEEYERKFMNLSRFATFAIDDERKM